MDYEESRPAIHSPLIQATSPQIKEFLQQRLQIAEQSARLWYRIDKHGNLRNTLIVDPERNEVDTMLIHIKDLKALAPLPNLISREQNLIDYSCEPTRPMETTYHQI